MTRPPTAKARSCLRLPPGRISPTWIRGQTQTHEWQARHKLPIDLMIHIGEERLPGDLETAIYRIVQESLTNIARYAGAHSVSVLVERRDGDVVAVVEDDGQGFDSAQNIGDRHLGLVGMRERAELLGGKLTIESEPGQGTGIHVQIPIIPVSRAAESGGEN